ncbi:glucosaminidase domain-containing protein [Companilactobacillus sp. HBUAS56257]|jgi:flagellum-specific peptidoglycan hydrolase FlgJ|uniref:glucosaminidase domain-containing protein n=1 Tax=Companilactobacillus sp. HBUAS56257 TaxID=3109360 RepID=UPI002FF2C331
MNKKWVASTALASFLAAVGVSSNTSPVKAAFSDDDGNQTDDQDEKSLAKKDETVASVMDSNGAPVDDDVADAIEANQNGTRSVLPANAIAALTQASSTSGVSATQQQAFLNKVAPMAQQAASKYNLYTSVMLAQAILESSWGTSTLSSQYNNYFGIKGSYNGQYVTMKTREWSAEKGYYFISDNFRKYPSAYESFADNGDKLRNGITGNNAFYKGTWRENTSSYKDATAWLQGRYATSPTYASVLNNIIESSNLTQYDGKASTSGTGNENEIDGTQTKMNDTATVVNKNSATIYINADPNKVVVNRALAYNTDWSVSSKVVTKDGTTYYQVATNEYVKASDMKLASEQTNPPVKIADTAIVIDSKGAVVYKTANLGTATNRVLPYQSAWITTKYVIDNSGNKFYFVGNDSYIKASDVTLKSQQSSGDYTQDKVVAYPDIVKITANPGAKVYDDKHNLLAVSLADSTNWKIDKKSTHSDGSTWYRVATNQWVSANDVEVKGSNYVTSVDGMAKINYIPGYGVNVYNSPAANNKFTGTRLADGTTWRVTSKQIVDGQTWYKVNAGWVNGKYCIFHEN